ncbi:MAG: ATP-grasp domain-containing protein [Myxococcales bacterium]|nr:ATP-grasp domain-containing protein [Myxococcales bacterium]
MVAGLSATGLAVARALGRRGYSVHAVETHTWEVGLRSRYVRSAATNFTSLIEGPPPHPDDRAVLFACGDPALVAVEALRDRLGPYCHLPAAPWVLDKRRLAQAASTADIRIPRTLGIDLSLSDAHGPLVVKPRFGGASPTRPFPEKARLVTSVPMDDPDLLVQELIPGPVDAIVVWAGHVGADGRVGPTVVGRKRRERPDPFGSASWLETITSDVVEAESRALVAALGLSGTLAIEWKEWAGERWLIEVNPRPVLWSAVADEVLVDAYAERAGKARPPARSVPAGRTWRYAARDPLSAPAGVDALWALDDPMPGLYGPAYTLRLLWERRRNSRF